MSVRNTILLIIEATGILECTELSDLTQKLLTSYEQQQFSLCDSENLVLRYPENLLCKAVGNYSMEH